eukprot:1195082-Prorocentrum_minimum.AAC.10
MLYMLPNKGHTRGQVPKPDGVVVGAGNDLRVRGLRDDGADGVVVAREAEGLSLGPHVPHAADRVAPARHQHVQRRVQRHAVHAAQVAVVVPDHLPYVIGKSEVRGGLRSGHTQNVWRQPSLSETYPSPQGVYTPTRLVISRRPRDDARPASRCGLPLRVMNRAPLWSHLPETRGKAAYGGNC